MGGHECPCDEDLTAFLVPVKILVLPRCTVIMQLQYFTQVLRDVDDKTPERLSNPRQNKLIM